MTLHASPRVLIVAITSCLMLGVMLVLLFSGDDAGASDEQQLRKLMESLTEAFNDHDWEEIAAASWPEDQREALAGELEAMNFLDVLRIEPPVDVRDIVVRGDVATCRITAKGGYAIGKGQWERSFTATLRRVNDEWLIDAQSTREAIEESR